MNSRRQNGPFSTRRGSSDRSDHQEGVIRPVRPPGGVIRPVRPPGGGHPTGPTTRRGSSDRSDPLGFGPVMSGKAYDQSCLRALEKVSFCVYEPFSDGGRLHCWLMLSHGFKCYVNNHWCVWKTIVARMLPSGCEGGFVFVGMELLPSRICDILDINRWTNMKQKS